MPTTGADAAPAADRIETDRLVLRPLDPSDADAIVALADDWEVARFTAGIPHPYERAHAEGWIERSAKARAESKGFVFAITDRADGSFLGGIGVHPSADGRHAVLGYWLGRRYWGRGYMTETVRAVLRFAFEELSVNRVTAGALPHNAASIRVQDKLGMRYVGREPAPARDDVEAVEVEVREITREDWQRG